MDIDKIYNEDCLKGMKKIPSESIDLVIADPPYTMTKRGKSCRPNWMPNNMGSNVFEGNIPDAKSWMSECFRVMKDGTHFYTFCNTNDIQKYLNIANEVGFKLHNIITMIKDTCMPNRWYLKHCELILFFRKGKAKAISNKGSKDYMFCKMPTQRNGKVHITQKPLEIITTLLTNSSEEGEVIFDPFMGSGTTAVAAINTGRRFIGFELQKEYFDIANKRIDETREKRKLRN